MGIGRARRLAAPLLGLALAGSLVAGCTSTNTAAQAPHHPAAPPAPVAQSAAVSFYPSAGSHGVNPADVISASVAHGTIGRITLTNAAG
ncbi:MAG TPA: hypothetical protein VHX38_20900, partial [Pseudonocardiaceae bacterium]|nr:hypothetical protein [Pseudonocardiaceae bacterium]